MPNVHDLCNEYSVWVASQGLPQMSADELACEIVAAKDGLSQYVTQQQVSGHADEWLEFLADFQNRWNAIV